MFGRSLRLAALALALLTAGAAAGSPASDEAAVKRAEDRGGLLYALDQAAWVSTDELMRVAPNARALGVAGYIVEPRGDLLRATYYRMVGGAPSGVFYADIRGGAVLSSHLLAPGEDATLSRMALRMIAARAAAAADAKARGLTPCTPAPFNTAVLPPAGDDAPVAVYLLTAQVKTGEFPYGGHFEIDVGPDQKVVFERPFTRSCLNIGQPKLPPGSKPVGGFVTHLLDQTPTEIHVYMSLWTHQPLYVGTTDPQRVWAVSAGKIRLVQMGAPK